MGNNFRKSRLEANIQMACEICNFVEQLLDYYSSTQEFKKKIYNRETITNSQVVSL